MAESYRGLTIRIGGDTTKLTQALHTANQAVSGTQSSLKKLSDALKLDPTSLKASQLQVGAFAAQASNAATRLVTLNDAMRQVGDKVKTFNGSAATVRDLASSWGNVNMVASQTRDYYEALTKTLATTYTEFSKTYSEASKMASIKVADNLKLDYGGFDNMSKQIKEIANAFNANDKQVEQFTARLEKVSQRYDDLCNKQEQYQAIVDQGDVGSKEFEKAANQLAKVNEQLAQTRTRFANVIEGFKGFKSDELFRYDADNTDLGSLAKSLLQMVEAEAMTVEQADKMYDSFDRMKNMWEEAFTNVRTANEVEGFKDLESETEKAAAKVKSLVDEMVRLSSVSNVAKGMVALKQQFTEITASGTVAEQRLKSILEVLSKDGNKSNTFLQREAMRDYAEATAEAQAAVDNIKEQLDQYDGTIRKLAADTKSYAEETAAANSKYEESAAALKGYEGALEELKTIRDGIVADNPSGFENDEDYQKVTQTIAAMEPVLAQLQAKFKDAAAEKEKFTQINEVRELTHELAIGLDKVSSLSNINFKPQVDVSAIDGLKKALEAISNGTFDARGISSFTDAVKVTSVALEEAKKKYQALSQASKSDPFNQDAYRQKMAALSEVTDKTVAHIESMKNALAAIPADKVNKVALETNTVAESYALAKKRVDDVTKAIEQTEEQIEQLTKERDRLKTVDDSPKEAVEELNKRIDELRTNLKGLHNDADNALEGLDIAENTRRVEEYTTAIERGEGELVNLGRQAKGLDATPKVDEAAFMQAVDRVAQAARRMGNEIVQSSNEIDSAYRDMRKTVQGTEQDFENLKQKAIEYSQNSITSADTMLEMQALGGQLGIVTEDLEQFGKITSNLDIATDLDAETVALKLGQIGNVLSLDIDGMQGFADALVRLGNNMPAQESAIMAVAQRFGAVAATASFSGEEILAWSAAIAATGQRSEAAATAISNTVSGIEQAIAGGGDQLKQFAAIASMSSDEFVKSWQDSPTQTLRAFIQGLETLKDSDESAVAALENMGITGVRQQQTLLALTQTIDSLDNALAMSGDAWNHVSDQWGTAGDAAIEAGRKSEGFSGALAIMQNNAQNLAASLGDGMIPFMKAAADIMAVVTDVLNNMDPHLKSIIVALGGAGIAFSTVTPLLNVFSKGMTGIIMAAAETGTIGQFILKITGLGDTAAAASLAAENLGVAISGPLVLGIGAAVAALGLAVSAISEYKEHQEQVKLATEGLVSAMESSQTAYNTYMAGAQESARTVTELKDAIEGATDAQANFAQQMSDRWGEIGTSEATVDMLVQKIAELTNQESLSVDKQNELRAAVDSYNNLTGQSVQIIDAQNGQLDTSVNKLQDYADAWKRSTENAQHMDDYGEILGQIAEKTALLDEVTQKLNEAGVDQNEWFTDMRNNAGTVGGSYSELSTQARELQDEIDALKQAAQQSVSGMTDLGQEVRVVEDAFAATGDSLSNYGSFTDSELQLIVDAFNDTSDSSISALDRVRAAIDGLRSGASTAGEIAGQLEEASKRARDAAYAAAKANADAEYNSMKASFDAQYKAAQSAYNAQYKAAQKAFDKQYKARQKAFDNEYKALQKKYDKEYKARQKAYDDEYKALKKKFDAEYKARKKAYDDQLAALKKSQSDEVDAFKKATDAKLKDMEREYKAKLKLLEAEYGGRTDDIDERIAALKSETEAEKKAIELRNQEDKKAELQKAVQQANSRRKRAEAEKALNDYLQEIEQKHNEDIRNAEIEQLEERKAAIKDELEERKALLKEQYDAEVEAYKENREAQLEALKDANTAEYEARKEAFDAQLEALKEYQTERLEALKESQQNALESLKENQQASLESLKESQQNQLEVLKESQQAQLESMRNSQQAALENMKASQQRQLQSLKESQKAQLEAIKNADAEAERERQRHADETERTGHKTGTGYVSGLSKGGALAGKASKNIARDASGPILGLAGSGRRYGEDFASSIADGMLSSYSIRRLTSASKNLAMIPYMYIHHSVPDKGPLSDDDKWGSDLVQNIIDGMREREKDLAKQVEKMSRVVEEGFDPTLTVDAAYEALDTISKNRSTALGSVVEKSSAPSITIEMNMNLSDVTIREDADIERLAEQLSQRMAAQAARQLAGRLG